MLGLVLPEAQLFVRRIKGKVVALAAAPDAALIRGPAARGVPVSAVFQQARVPFQSQAVAARARLPEVLHRAAALKLRDLHTLRQDLEHGTLDACQKSKHRGRWLVDGLEKCFWYLLSISVTE